MHSGQLKHFHQQNTTTDNNQSEKSSKAIHLAHICYGVVSIKLDNCRNEKFVNYNVIRLLLLWLVFSLSPYNSTFACMKYGMNINIRNKVENVMQKCINKSRMAFLIARTIIMIHGPLKCIHWTWQTNLFRTKQLCTEKWWHEFIHISMLIQIFHFFFKFWCCLLRSLLPFVFPLKYKHSWLVHSVPPVKKWTTNFESLFHFFSRYFNDILLRF